MVMEETLRQVSWLSVHRASPAFPERIQWHGVAKRSPITVAGAAPDFELDSAPDSLLTPWRGNHQHAEV